MKFLLDTCVLSDFVRGNTDVASTLRSKPPTDVAISSVTWMEVRYGLELNPERGRKIEPVITALVTSMAIISYDRDDAFFSAACRARLRLLGTPIGPYDLMIAGCALNRGLILVTSNTGEFERVDGLKIQDWRGTTPH